VRQARAKRRQDIIRHPTHLFDPIYVQSIGIIQAPDVLGDGRTDMCDSCPDITYYQGQFVNSCRMDEYRLFGGFISLKEKENAEQTAATENVSSTHQSMPQP